MKPLEVWTCQRAENLKKKSSKIPKNNYAAKMVSAARRSTKVGGGGAHKLSAAAARRGRRTALACSIFKITGYQCTVLHQAFRTKSLPIPPFPPVFSF